MDFLFVVNMKKKKKMNYKKNIKKIENPVQLDCKEKKENFFTRLIKTIKKPFQVFRNNLEFIQKFPEDIMDIYE